MIIDEQFAVAERSRKTFGDYAGEGYEERIG